jgi:hypothetical protein
MHINLIMENEQRSASPVSLAMLVKIIVATLITIMVLTLISAYFKYHNLKSSVAISAGKWKETEPKHLAAKQLKLDLDQKNTKLKEIQGWKTTRIHWGQQLESLQTMTPSMIQLSELQVTQDILVRSNIPSRVFEMRLAGKTSSAGSEIHVRDFQQALFRQPPFDSLIETVSIPAGAFRQDPANKADRIFEISCKYNPRSFK